MAADGAQQVEDQFAGAIDMQRIRVVVVGAGQDLEDGGHGVGRSG